MKLAAVIVNYNVKHYLAQCLQSLYRSLEGMSAEIYVVDNCSTDHSKELIERMFPDVVYITNSTNVGFARACNQAIRLTDAEYVLLINPDTIVPEGNIKAVIGFMDSHPDAGACGVRMINGSGRFLPESKRGFPSVLATLKRFVGAGHRTNGYYMSLLDEHQQHSVDVLAGAYMMIRHEALKRAGLLSEEYFMFGEDIDLSVGITECGYRNYYLPETILHYKGESTDRDDERFIRSFYGAMGIFIGRHRDRYNMLLRPLMQALVLIIIGVKIALTRTVRLIARKAERPKPRFIIIADERGINSIKTILKRNGVDAGCHCVIGSERTVAAGHAIGEGEFTHVIYDSNSFSYAAMVGLIDLNSDSGMKLGVYHREMRCIITPESVYE